MYQHSTKRPVIIVNKLIIIIIIIKLINIISRLFTIVSRLLAILNSLDRDKKNITLLIIFHRNVVINRLVLIVNRLVIIVDRLVIIVNKVVIIVTRNLIVAGGLVLRRLFVQYRKIFNKYSNNSIPTLVNCKVNCKYTILVHYPPASILYGYKHNL